jgi:stage V sporulation protein SpoVS
MLNPQRIGETAGAVWQYLKDNGKTTLKALEKGVGAPAEAVSMAAGWLAREGKVEVAQEKRSIYIWLIES